MKKECKTQTIGELINSSVFSQMKQKNKVNSIIKHSTIFSFWTNVVGAKFSHLTKPYSIKFNKLYVSAKSPIIVQELNLYKRSILVKLNSYSKPLGIEISDIIFSYKNFVTSSPIEDNRIEDKPVFLSDSELEEVEIDKSTKENIKKHIDKINFLSDEQKEKLTNKIIKNKKAQMLQEK